MSGWGNRSFPMPHEPTLSYERGPEGPAIGTLTDGNHVLMWTLELGSKREMLFLAFLAEFMTPKVPE